jgi:DNA-binding response OmpR family regulator
MLTASGTVDDRVDGLTLGADDYLPKPFALAELVARIRTLGRRAAKALPPILSLGDVTLDPYRREATRRQQPLNLTNKELGVLEVLLAASGGVISAEDLLERVWDAHADPFTNTVRVTIANLRRKLGEPPVIETVVGAGYRVLTT